MAIKARLRSIENRIGAQPCECCNEKIEIVTVHPGEPEPPAEICPKCGRTKMMIVVKHVERGMWGQL